MFLLPPSVKEFIDERHPAHLINDMVEKLDIKVFMHRYGEMGQPAYSPRMMLKVILIRHDGWGFQFAEAFTCLWRESGL
jgi:transposase